jgi:hypothetical protein
VMIIGPHTILKNAKTGERSFFAFSSMVWGDRIIITPSDFSSEK